MTDDYDDIKMKNNDRTGRERGARKREMGGVITDHEKRVRERERGRKKNEIAKRSNSLSMHIKPQSSYERK